MSALLRLSFLLTLVFALSGCKGKPATAKVTGKVTVDGTTPLKGGEIQFILVSDITVVGGGRIKGDGTYEVTNAPVGDCKVVIDNKHLDSTGGRGGPPVVFNDSSKMKGTPKDVSIPPMSKEPVAEYRKISAATSKFDSTPLTSKVDTSGATPADFDVKSDSTKSK